MNRGAQLSKAWTRYLVGEPHAERKHMPSSWDRQFVELPSDWSS